MLIDSLWRYNDLMNALTLLGLPALRTRLLLLLIKGRLHLRCLSLNLPNLSSISCRSFKHLNVGSETTTGPGRFRLLKARTSLALLPFKGSLATPILLTNLLIFRATKSIEIRMA
jgi:hypothetical protein